MPAPKFTRQDFRKSRNFYIAEASEMAAPALRLIGRLAASAPTARQQWRKGLIISHAHIGDVLYRTPSLVPLAAALPNCEWHFLTSEEAAPVLADNPAIAKVLPYVRGETSWSLTDGAFSKLRRESFDIALCSNSLGHYPDFILAVALGIPNRVGYSNRGASGFLTHPVAIESRAPFPSYFRAMVAQICGIEPDWPLTPRLWLSDAARAAADRFLASVPTGPPMLVACCPFSRQTIGQWPEDIFVDAINALSTLTQIQVLLCGSAAERAGLERCARALHAPATVLAGGLDLRAFAALLGRCQVVLAQDSAPRHLANAANVPVVFLRNLAVVPEESGVYCENEFDAAPRGGAEGEGEIAALQAQLSPGLLATKLLTMARN